MLKYVILRLLDLYFNIFEEEKTFNTYILPTVNIFKEWASLDASKPHPPF